MAKTAKCIACNAEINKTETLTHQFRRDRVRTLTVKATAFHHPTGERWYCAECIKKMLTALDGGTYSRENHDRKSNPTADGHTISQEIEVGLSVASTFTDEELCSLCAELVSRGCLPTSDCTVYGEFKTMVYNGLQSHNKDLKSICEHMQLHRWHTDPSYGTHTNIGHVSFGYSNMLILRQFRETLLYPLQSHLKDNPTETKRIWGRPIGGTWAEEMYGSADQHTAFINLQHINETKQDCNWVEFRLNKMQSYSQNSYVVKICIALFDVMKDFTEKIALNRLTYNGRVLADKNMETARKYAEKLVKVYDKMATAVAEQRTHTA